MKIPLKTALLLIAACAWASAAHAQVPATTTSTDGTAGQGSRPANSTEGMGKAPGRPHGPVRRPAIAANSNELNINGNSAHRTIDCKGNTITVNGNGNRLLLRGTCAKLTLNGSNNTVRWSGTAPALSDLGINNVTGQIN